jgi:uncharacterized protein YdcH (DUF465 family)
MEKRDLELIEKYSPRDEVLARLYNDHLLFESELSELEKRTYLTPEEEARIKELKKKKLLGKDRIEAILRKYRALEGN